MILTFGAGVDTIRVDIPIINDNLCEPDEIFQLNLDTADPDVNLDPATGFVTIQDDDGELNLPCLIQKLKSHASYSRVHGATFSAFHTVKNGSLL